MYTMLQRGDVVLGKRWPFREYVECVGWRPESGMKVSGLHAE